MKKIPNRRPSWTEDVGMGISVTVSFHPETQEAVEVLEQQVAQLVSILNSVPQVTDHAPKSADGVRRVG